MQQGMMFFFIGITMALVQGIHWMSSAVKYRWMTDVHVGRPREGICHEALDYNKKYIPCPQNKKNQCRPYSIPGDHVRDEYCFARFSSRFSRELWQITVRKNISYRDFLWPVGCDLACFLTTSFLYCDKNKIQTCNLQGHCSLFIASSILI